MTLSEVKDLFFQCEYPFYKGLTIHETVVNATLYSLKCECKKEIAIDISDPQKAIHQLAIEIIKFRSMEMQADDPRFA
ncbi:hypothetical protein [Brevibacillus migulae]|uniref:hypothetical protein n=1 Tax=Brevibacillus migulae TaxID=1644114 RepID=UPI00106E7A37|nr:hypothetical protein [Brevibacillus migulae]